MKTFALSLLFPLVVVLGSNDGDVELATTIGHGSEPIAANGSCDKKFTTNIDRVVHVQVRYNCRGNCYGDCGSEVFAFDLQGYQDEYVMQVNGQVCYRSRVDGYTWSDWTSGGCLEARITTWGKQ